MRAEHAGSLQLNIWRNASMSLDKKAQRYRLRKASKRVFAWWDSCRGSCSAWKRNSCSSCNTGANLACVALSHHDRAGTARLSSRFQSG